MTILFILLAIYAVSFYLLRKLLIKDGLTDGVGMLLVITPFFNTFALFIISGSILFDRFEAKVFCKKLVKKFFG